MAIDIEDIEVKSILTKSQINAEEGMLVANPYIGCTHSCIYCYATFMIRFSGHAGQKWGTFVDIKHWKPLTERQKAGLKDKSIMIASVTDAYQPIEKTACRTQELLEELKDTGASVQILTKSTLCLRDLPIFKSFKGKIAIGFSINTLDDKWKKELDYGSKPSDKLNALKTLHENGIYTYVFIAPIMPAVTDVKGILSVLDKQCHVNEVWLDKLNLESTTARHNISEWLKGHEDIRPLYEDPTYWVDLKKDIKSFCKERNYRFIQNTFTNFSYRSFTVSCFF